MALTFDAKANFAYSVVAVAPSPAASGTSLQVAPGDGAKFPTPPFNAVIWPTVVQPTTANAEVVRVTNISTDTLTITRAQESSVARTVVVNDQIALNVTAKTLTDIQAGFTTASILAMPIGGMCAWPTDSAPTGFLLCRGQAVSRATYATLFALISTTYGAGDGATTFNLPDLQGRLAIGKATSGTLGTLAVTSGSWDHTHGPGTLTVGGHTHTSGTLQVESHTHGAGTLAVASHTHGVGTFSVDGHTHDSGSYAAASDGAHTHTGTTDNDGEHGHNVNTSTAMSGGDFEAVTDVDNGGIHSHDFTTSSNGSHTHDVSGDSGSATASISGTSGSTAPSVSSGSTGGTAPFVTGGTTGSSAPGVSGGVTAAGNPPVLVINWIIRATNEA